MNLSRRTSFILKQRTRKPEAHGEVTREGIEEMSIIRSPSGKMAGMLFTNMLGAKTPSMKRVEL
jgi:hypothetical protein